MKNETKKNEVKSKKWMALCVECLTSQNEQVVAIIYEHSKSSGVEIKDGEKPGSNLIITYFSETDTKLIDTLKKKIMCDEMIDGCQNIKFNVYEVNEEDWANSWKKFFSPKKLGKRIIVTPSWEDFKAPKNSLPIFIEPGMAFGTGHHETTHLCVKLVEETIKKDDYVLDVGTGTGILAIAAYLLGAKLVVGTDNDKYAVRIARENIELNKCSDRVKAFYGNLLKFRSTFRDELLLQKCDVVICNILKDAVLRLPPQLKEFMRHNGVVIISGILESQFEEIKKVFEKNDFIEKRYTQDKEWVACAFKYCPKI